MEKDCNQKNDSKIRELLQGGDECRWSNRSLSIFMEHKNFIKREGMRAFLKKIVLEEKKRHSSIC